MLCFNLFLGLFALLATTDAQRVIRGSWTHLSAAWLSHIDLRLSGDSRVQFLSRTGGCGSITPPLFEFRNFSSVVYQHMGCAWPQDIAHFLVTSSNFRSKIRTITFRVLSRSKPLVTAVGEVSTTRGGHSKPFGIEIAVGKDQNCVFSLQSPLPWVVPHFGDVDGLEASTRYACAISQQAGLVYRHRGSKSSEDFIPVTVWFLDGDTGKLRRVEYGNIRIDIVEPLHNNTIPQLSSSSSLKIVVQQHSMTPVLPTALAAVDEDDMNSRLIIAFGLGFDPHLTGVVFSLDNPFPVYGDQLNVTQGDVSAGRVAYRPPIINKQQTVQFSFDVIDSSGGRVSSQLSIEIKKVDENAPFVIVNEELVVERGKRGVINSDILKILSSKDLAAVTLRVTHPPLAGSLKVVYNGVQGDASVILVEDLENDRIVYESDRSAIAESDRLIMEISDGEHTFNCYFLIFVYTTRPHISVVSKITVYRNQAVMVSNHVFSVDCPGCNLTFALLDGETVKGKLLVRGKEDSVYINTIESPDGLGQTKSENVFSLSDIYSGRVWYIPTRNRAIRSDSLNFNVSTSLFYQVVLLEVQILHSTDERLHLADGTSLLMMVKEKSKTALTTEAISYVSKRYDPVDIKYVVTRPPLVVSSEIEGEDAGQLVWSSRLRSQVDDIVYEFSQKDIMGGKVLYKAPSRDIGLKWLSVVFHFRVSDEISHLFDQQFTIEIEPVNDMPPEIVQDEEILVREDGSAAITSKHLKAVDPDTHADYLSFTLTDSPRYGILRHLGRKHNLTVGDVFSVIDINSLQILYYHTDGDVRQDQFNVRVSDGLHTVEALLPIIIQQVDDTPRLIKTVTYNVSLSALKSRILIGPDNLLVFDPDTPDDTIRYTLKVSLRFGEIELKQSRGVFETTTVFTQSNITAHRVYFHAINPHLLTANVTERIIFTVGKGRRTRDVDFEVNIRIPQSQALSVVMASPFKVQEASSKAIERKHLSVNAATIRLGDTHFTIRDHPQYGNVSVRGLTGSSVMSFTLMDIRLLQVTYLQTWHQGVEPLNDSFTFDVTDGLAVLTNVRFKIAISPVDDEPPVVVKHHPGPIVSRKERLTIGPDVITITDADVSSAVSDVRIRMAVVPRHGHIAVLTDRDELKRLKVRDSFSTYDIDDLKVVYAHDGSPSLRDSFNFSVSDGYHVVDDYLEIEIFSPNTHKPVVVNNTGLVVQQDMLEVLISLVNLSAWDEDSLPVELVYTIVSPPSIGSLQFQTFESGKKLVRSLRKGSHFTQADVDYGHVFYTHDGQTTGLAVFVFSLTDGKHVLKRQRFRVSVKPVDLQPPAVAANKGITVKAGTAGVIIPLDLKVTDNIVPSTEVTFSIVNSSFLGFFSFVGSVDKSIDQFSQADIDVGRLSFFAARRPQRLLEMVMLSVSDGSNAVMISFVVRITPDPAFLPKLVNKRLSLYSNEDKTIDLSHLALVDTETPHEDIVYTVVSLPLYGQLRVSHGSIWKEVFATGGTFSQQDIIDGDVSYILVVKDRIVSGDSFVFHVFDRGYSNYSLKSDQQSRLQAFSSHQVFIISVITVDEESPFMVTNMGFDYLLSLEGGLIGRPLSHSKLQAADDVSDRSSLRYIIKKAPKHGELRSLGKQRVSHFRQQDIDDGLVVYILRDKDMAITQDSFTFSVKDEQKNVLKDQVFNISWIYLIVTADRLKVQERDGTINVTVRRIGNADIPVSFTCKTESGTALEALPGFRLHEGKADFKAVSSLQTIAEREVTSHCLIEIDDDSKHEGAETFRVTVMQPVFAHVGEPSYVDITIVDPEDEPILLFEAVNMEVSEDSGDMQLPVKRIGDLTDTVSVVCYTESGSATGSTPPYLLTGDDYVTRTNSRLSKIVFEPGVSVKLCSVSILDDTMTEESETFSVHLVPRGIGVRLDQNRSTVDVTIIGPNDESTVQFSSSNYQVNESSGEVTITIHRVGPDVSFSVGVWFTTKDDKPASAQHDQDYIQQSRLVEFPRGVRVQTVRVRIVDDDVEDGRPVLEGPETFNVMLVSATRVGIGNPHEATVTIDDWEDTAIVEFLVAAIATDEGPLLQLEVVRLGSTNFLTKVRCYTRPGSAEEGTDFVNRPNSDMSIVKFERGEVSQKCYVVVLDDDHLEGEETFSVFLDNPSDGARLGLSEVRVTIRDPDDVPSIQFESVAVTWSEPTSPNERDSSVLTLVLQRVGDLNLSSSVRVHTQDGSAKSGQDYEPVSDTVTFRQFERRKTVTVKILFDQEKELGETFFVVILLPPHSVHVQLGNKQRVSVTISDFAPSGVNFLLKPKVQSLLEYGSAMGNGKEVSPGYPVICVSSCDSRFGNPKALDHCTKEMIDHSRTQYKWEVAEPELSSPFREIVFSSVFTNQSGVTLDSVYFKPGGQVRCLATPVDSKGVAGIEMASQVVTVSRRGICNPGHSIQLDPGEIETQMKYVGGAGTSHPESVETLVHLPHVDGYIPLISTHPLGSLALALTITAARSEHVCSNMVMGPEQKTIFGFVQPFIPGNEPTGSGFNYPYQFDPRYRDVASLSLYQYLDLDQCQWKFRTWFTVAELLNDCGAQMSEDTKDAVIISPLYISYVHFSASTVWRFLSESSKLVFTLSSGGSDNPTKDTNSLSEAYTDEGQIYTTRMYIRQSDGKLEMHFLSVALFRGQFVVSHPLSAYESHVESPTDSVQFELELLDTEPTVHRVKQKWRIVSEYSLPNYIGKYGLVLVPCIVADHVQWSPRFNQICEPGDPIEFFVRIDFQQTLNPQPVSYGLNTRFEVLHTVENFLRYPVANQDPQELEPYRPFRRGDTIYGRAMVDPSQELREGFHLLIEKVHLCAGRDGYVPLYDPSNNHYGCLEPSIELAYHFKILDRDNPGGVDLAFQSIPFEAEFASDNSSYDQLTRQHDDDGFTVKVAPLYKASSGYSWYLQVVYSIKGSGNGAMSRTRRESPTDDTEQFTGLGTALQPIPLLYGPEEDISNTEVAGEPTKTAPVAASKGGGPGKDSIALAITLGIIIPLVIALLLVLVILLWRYQRRETKSKNESSATPADTDCYLKNRKESGFSVQHGSNPYLSSFLHVCSDNENSSVKDKDIDRETDDCDSDVSSVMTDDDYAGDVSDDNTSSYSTPFKIPADKRCVAQEPIWETTSHVADDDHVTTL